MKNLFDRHAAYFFAAALLLCACFSDAQTVSPFMGIGDAQFFDNNGKPLTAGVLYSYQAGTTTQQATYTDYTGLTQNPNPMPFSSGARVSLWLTSTASYKFVLCLQNDGAACAPSDVLFSMDHVPGCMGCSTGANIFIGTFISGTLNPASTGILELASIDSICWRNTAGNANLCISKDTSDVLTWTGGVIKLPEGSCTATATGQDYLCPNSATHRLSVANNNGAYGALPLVPTAGASGHLVGFTANGIDLLDSGGTPPVSTAVVFSATPTFTATSQNQLFTMSLTGNVASSTLVMSGLPTPSLVTFELTEDATGGRTFVFPPNILGATPITTTANTVNLQQFVWDGTNARAIVPAPVVVTSVTKDFSVTGCVTATSTDSSCTGTITISPAFADASYIPQLTINSFNGAFVAISISGSLTSSSIPYTITCTFSCGAISTPTIYVHAFHP